MGHRELDVPPESSLADVLTRVNGLSSVDLIEVAAAVATIQQERAVAELDVDAIIERSFTTDFRSSSPPSDPYLVHSLDGSALLVCCGYRADRSGTSHDCAFVAVADDGWVWESSLVLRDVVRNIPGPKPRMHSVSVLPVHEGLEVSFVVSTTKAGVHRAKRSTTYRFTGGDLVVVGHHVPSAVSKHSR